MNCNKSVWLAVVAAIALSGCADDPVSVQDGLPHEAQRAVEAGQYSPGTSYFGENDYVEYIAGNLPLIFSASHGGGLQPATIPVRTAEACGGSASIVRDANTQELVRAIQDAFVSRTGHYPHIVINRLHRDRLDANRDIGEAACGNPAAEQAWNEYHDFIEVAKARILADFGKGWYTDVHGHGHDIQRLELGYQVSAARLRLTDASLDSDPDFESSSSIGTFSQQSPLAFSALLRGPTALGTLFENAGYRAVPSQQDPAPAAGEPFFSGGYSTDRHGCRNGGQICGVQIEANMDGVRNSVTNRARFAAEIVPIYIEHLAQFGINLPVPPAPAFGEPLIVQHDNMRNHPTLARFRASSNWSVGSSSGSYNGTNFRFESGNLARPDDEGAEFFFHVSTPGTYMLDGWWPTASTRAEDVAYQVYERDGAPMLAEFRVNQRINGARWNSFGWLHFREVGWARVRMARSLNFVPIGTPGATLAADAIRVTHVDVTPQVSEFAGATLLPGETYTRAGSFTDLGGDTWTATVNYGDGSGTQPLELSEKSFSLSHTYTQPGTFTVRVAVTLGANDETYTGTRTAVVTVQSHAQAVATLAGDVNAIVQAGRLPAGNGTALDAILRAAIRQLDRGNATAGANQIQAFINEVESLVDSGRLSAADGENLTGLAGRILQSISGTTPPPPAQPAICVEGSAECASRLMITPGGYLPLFSTQPLTQANPAAVEAVIVVHGVNRDADAYFETMVAATRLAGRLEQSLIVAPHFQIAEDGPSSDEPFWSGAGWRRGNLSVPGELPRVSSYTALDRIIEELSDRSRFPNLTRIIVAGHSAGGQVTHRFAAGSRAEHNASGITFRYVVANPSTYLYLGPERPAADGFALPVVSECPNYNQWHLGMEELNAYMAAVPLQQVQAQLVERDVRILLGDRDTVIGGQLDVTCGANLQGAQRFERGRNLVRYLNEFHPGHRHLEVIVPDVGHSALGMFTSPAGRQTLFAP